MIWLPPPSTHSYLSLGFIRRRHFQKRVHKFPKVDAKREIEGKIIGALHAWYEAASWPYVSSPWRMAGFRVDFPILGRESEMELHENVKSKMTRTGKKEKIKKKKRRF
jgi:hypothetical protein